MSFRDKTVNVGIGGVDLVLKEGGTGGFCTPSEIGCVKERIQTKELCWGCRS